MERRDIVRVCADKLRVGIVISVDGSDVRIIAGTTKEHDFPSVVVHPTTKQGRMMDLRDPTFFYGRDASWYVQTQVEQVLGRCSWELFLSLARIVEEWDGR